MDRDQLDTAIEQAPAEPGVYLFKEGKRVLYVGKAVDIQDRLRSYRDPRTPRIREMVRNADTIETRTTDDGRRALLLEANLIKQDQPRYNTRLKDGKSYPVIELTDHRFPQIRASRDPEAHSMVFGPFTSMQDVETAIKAFRDLYGLRACSDHTFETRDRPCVAYQMGLCSAPCAGLITEDEYAERVETLTSFFREDPGPVFEELEATMQEAAEDRRYERAATLRDYRGALETLLEGREKRQTRDTHAIAVGAETQTIGHVRVEDDQIAEKQPHQLTGAAETDADAVSSFIEQYYAYHELPATIIVQTMPDDTMVRDWLSDEGTEIRTPETGRDRVLIDTAQSATAQTVFTMPTLEEYFYTTIARIECFDISHTGGENVIGSDVVFEEGEAVKEGYRRKQLPAQNDDYENMARLLKWRAERQLEGRDERPVPDLLVIDGGIEQLKAARRTLKTLGWEIPVVAIAKPDDRIIAPDGSVLDVEEPARQWLRSARDEAHRFAKTTHTAQRDEVESALEEIEGIGPERRKAILSSYSLSELDDASIDDLAAIEGIGRETAETIKKRFEDH